MRDEIKIMNESFFDDADTNSLVDTNQNDAITGTKYTHSILIEWPIPLNDGELETAVQKVKDVLNYSEVDFSDFKLDYGEEDSYCEFELSYEMHTLRQCYMFLRMICRALKQNENFVKQWDYNNVICVTNNETEEYVNIVCTRNGKLNDSEYSIRKLYCLNNPGVKKTSNDLCKNAYNIAKLYTANSDEFNDLIGGVFLKQLCRITKPDCNPTQKFVYKTYNSNMLNMVLNSKSKGFYELDINALRKNEHNLKFILNVDFVYSENYPVMETNYNKPLFDDAVFNSLLYNDNNAVQQLRTNKFLKISYKDFYQITLNVLMICLSYRYVYDPNKYKVPVLKMTILTVVSEKENTNVLKTIMNKL